MSPDRPPGSSRWSCHPFRTRRARSTRSPAAEDETNVVAVTIVPDGLESPVDAA
ncbi:MAG TPA: hypothetical protein VIK65_00525 [Candidatus Limnocylindrales bacterium]